jgi:hypothetical protein
MSADKKAESSNLQQQHFQHVSRQKKQKAMGQSQTVPKQFHKIMVLYCGTKPNSSQTVPQDNGTLLQILTVLLRYFFLWVKFI